jgi:predicted Zn-dependent protease
MSVVDRLAELQPGDEAPQLDFLRSLYLAGQVDRARAVLPRLGPKAGPARREALLAIWMDAEVPPERLIMLPPPGALGWYAPTVAEYCVRKGRADLALRLLRDELNRAVSLGNVERQAILASALLAVGKGPAADARARAALSLDARQPIALLVRGRLALGRGDFDSALRDSRVVIADNPTLGSGYQLLADTYTAKHDMPLADKAVTDGSATAASADQLQYSVEYFRKRAKLEQAISVLRDFTAKNPLSRLGWKLRLSVCSLQNDLPCVRRSSELLRRLNGGPIDYSIKPEDSALNEV